MSKRARRSVVAPLLLRSGEAIAPQLDVGQRTARHAISWCGVTGRTGEASTGPPALPPSAKATRPSPKAVTLMRVKGLTASVRLCGPGSARRRMQGNPQAETKRHGPDWQIQAPQSPVGQDRPAGRGRGEAVLVP